MIVNYILYLLEEKIALHVRQFPSPASVLICLTLCVITKRPPLHNFSNDKLGKALLSYFQVVFIKYINIFLH